MKSLKPCAVISVSASYITVPGSGYLTGTLPEGAMVGTVHATDLPWLKEVYSNISNHKDFKLTLFRKVEVTRVHYDALQVEVFHLVNESLGEGQGADLGQMKFANLASCMRLKLPSRQRDNVECRWKCAAAIPGTDKSAARVRRRESRAGAGCSRFLPGWICTASAIRDYQNCFCRPLTLSTLTLENSSTTIVYVKLNSGVGVFQGHNGGSLAS